MRILLTAAVFAAAASAPALADPAPSVTVTYEYNYRPGPRAVTGEDGSATLPVEAPGVYEVMVAEPLATDAVVFVSAGGSEASMSLPRGTVVGTRFLGFRLLEGETITVRVDAEPPPPAE